VIKKLCLTGALVAAAAGVVFTAAPAQADDWTSNWSNNSQSVQSGNNFADVVSRISAAEGSTNVNNLNGIATTATNGSISVTYIFN
jgi:hypothetical protein